MINNTEKQVFEFTSVQSLQLENSFTIIKQAESVELNVSVGINDSTYGWFELYDIESGGDEWYAQGGLWFEGKKVTGYDGVFSLMPCIVDKLKELGFDTSEVE